MEQKSDAAVAVLKNPKICSVEGCGRKHVAKGLCGSHHKRIDRFKGQWASELLRPYTRKK